MFVVKVPPDCAVTIPVPLAKVAVAAFAIALTLGLDASSLKFHLLYP